MTLGRDKGEEGGTSSAPTAHTRLPPADRSHARLNLTPRARLRSRTAERVQCRRRQPRRAPERRGSCHRRPILFTAWGWGPSPRVRGGVLTVLHGVPVTHICSLLRQGAGSLYRATCWTGRPWGRTSPRPLRGARWAGRPGAEHARGPAVRAPCRTDASAAVCTVLAEVAGSSARPPWPRTPKPRTPALPRNSAPRPGHSSLLTRCASQVTSSRSINSTPQKGKHL